MVPHHPPQSPAETDRHFLYACDGNSIMSYGLECSNCAQVHIPKAGPSNSGFVEVRPGEVRLQEGCPGGARVGEACR
jgi:hypothetical protein